MATDDADDAICAGQPDMAVACPSSASSCPSSTRLPTLLSLRTDRLRIFLGLATEAGLGLGLGQHHIGDT